MQTTTKLPLCIDLDGTLIHTDSLWETCLRLLVNQPWLLMLLPLWLLKGKAGFKHRISQHQTLAPESLPYNQALLDYIRTQKQQGRKIILVTAANERIANAVAEHLGLFDEILASTAELNLSGSRKAAALIEKFGEAAFVYAANAHVDLAVWQHAAAAILVNASRKLQQTVSKQIQIEATIEPPVRSSMPMIIIKAIRIHQWSKNALILVPLVLSHNLNDPQLLIVSLLAFLSFSFAASAIYLINDLSDLPADRAHASKKFRPLAAGTLSIPAGIVLAILLLLMSLAIALLINKAFILVLLVYLILTTAYSLYLKPLVLLDVLTLTSLYTLRIVAGGAAIATPASYWLLAFSMFIFLSLALSKRYSELLNLKLGDSEKQKARGYHVEDLPLISLFGVTSGYLSVLVLVLYIHDLQADALYSVPDWLWMVSMSILYWISRIWVLANRGELHEDPVLFALHDRVSYIVSILVIFSILLAL